MEALKEFVENIDSERTRVYKFIKDTTCATCDCLGHSEPVRWRSGWACHYCASRAEILKSPLFEGLEK